MIELSETTAQAIRSLDEHWDGGGYPYGLAGDAIPLFGRILCLAQTAEVFFGVGGPRAALEVAADRRGTWFDPELVGVLRGTRRDRGFWDALGGAEPHGLIGAFEPEDRVQRADEERLDRVAEAFALIVDAKSPYTRRHSELTVRILERVGAFRELAATAGAHHERLDGGGYHLGLTGDQLNRDARILAVADVCEALTAERPYRGALPPDEVRAIMRREALCPEALSALEATREMGVLGVATPATAAARPAAR